MTPENTDSASVPVKNTHEKKATGWPLAIIVTLVFIVLICAWVFLIRTALDNKPEVIEVTPAAKHQEQVSPEQPQEGGGH